MSNDAFDMYPNKEDRDKLVTGMMMQYDAQQLRGGHAVGENAGKYSYFLDSRSGQFYAMEKDDFKSFYNGTGKGRFAKESEEQVEARGYYTLLDLGRPMSVPSESIPLGEVNMKGMGIYNTPDIEDAIITSDGQVIHTDPEDSIYAFKGAVSIAPANSTREFSGSPINNDNSQSNSTTNNITNNYVSQANFNLADLFPASEFDPVGV
jgi:hypothetical protein